MDWPLHPFADEVLAARPPRPVPVEAQIRVLEQLAQAVADPARNILQELVEGALSLCGAHSAGVSLIEFDGPHKVFRWHALAGVWSGYLMSTMPRDASPCGVVVDRRAAQVMPEPHVYFSAMLEAQPIAAEALLVPFDAMDETVGTVWIVSHDPAVRFSADDLRVMRGLAHFAAAAYVTRVTLRKTLDAQEEYQRAIQRLRRENERLRGETAS